MTSIVEVYRRWPTKEACIEHLEAVRWGESPTCPYCGAVAVSQDHSFGACESKTSEDQHSEKETACRLGAVLGVP
jgi:Transposase zinc-ribbon domain